jgi:hypothetical protein
MQIQKINQIEPNSQHTVRATKTHRNFMVPERSRRTFKFDENLVGRASRPPQNYNLEARQLTICRSPF